MSKSSTLLRTSHGRRNWLCMVTVLTLICIAPGLLADDTSEGLTTDNSDAEATRMPAFDLTVGPLTHVRGVEERAADAPITQQSSPMAGVAVSVRTLLLWIPGLNARLEFEGDIQHAVGRSRQLSGLAATPRIRHTRGSGGLRLSRPLGNGFSTGFAMGVAAESWVLPPNPGYTGNRYVGGEFGWGIRYELPGQPLEFAARISGLPVFEADSSGGRHGQGTAFGGRLDLRGTWRPFAGDHGTARSDFLVDAHLEGTRYRGRFPASAFDPAGATVVDRSASFTIGVGYRLH